MLATATQPNGETFISNLQSGKPNVIKRTPDGLNPRATRYGAVPIQNIGGLQPSAVNMWELPANVFIAFDVFTFPTTNESGKRVDKDVPTSEQIADMHTASEARPFCEFPEIAQLESRENAREVFQVLQNPNVCEKYPNQLGNKCATCWLNWINSPEFEARLQTEFQGRPLLDQVARKTAERWLKALTEALSIAGFEYQSAMEEIENPKLGKNVFYEYDYTNMWHIHASPPVFRRTVSPTEGLGDEIGRALAQYLPAVQTREHTAPGNEDVLAKVAAMLAEQQTEMDSLRKQLGAQATIPAVETPNSEPIEPVLSNGQQVLVDGKVGELMSKTFGRYKVRFDDGSTGNFSKEQVSEVKTDEL